MTNKPEALLGVKLRNDDLLLRFYQSIKSMINQQNRELLPFLNELNRKILIFATLSQKKYNCSLFSVFI
jgi:hypothetical protein